MKVYVVTLWMAPECYGVYAVCATRELAERWCEENNDMKYSPSDNWKIDEEEVVK